MNICFVSKLVVSDVVSVVASLYFLLFFLSSQLIFPITVFLLSKDTYHVSIATQCVITNAPLVMNLRN